MEQTALDEDVTWISVREAAAILDLSHNTIRKMIRAGEIETINTFSARHDVILDRAYIERLAAERKAKAA